MRNLFFAQIIPLIAACSSYDLGNHDPLEIQVNAANPAWESGIQEIMAKKCDNCHGAVQSQFIPGNAKGLDYNFALKEEFEQRLVRIEARTLKSADMPPDFATPLTANERLALTNYIELLKR